MLPPGPFILRFTFFGEKQEVFTYRFTDTHSDHREGLPYFVSRLPIEQRGLVIAGFENFLARHYSFHNRTSTESDAGYEASVELRPMKRRPKSGRAT